MKTPARFMLPSWVSVLPRSTKRDGGPVKTPVLDKLAAEGVRFTDFRAYFVPCRFLFRHHRTTSQMHLLKSETTIAAEVLKENG